VQALVGHAHLTTTQRYAHVAVDLRAAIERLAGDGVVTAW
jgi:site-specific recombinase XerD